MDRYSFGPAPVFSAPLSEQVAGLFPPIMAEMPAKPAVSASASFSTSPSSPPEETLAAIRSCGRRSFTIGLESIQEIIPGEPFSPANINALATMVGNHFRGAWSIGLALGIDDPLLGRDLALAAMLQSTGAPPYRHLLQGVGQETLFSRPDAQEIPRWVSGYTGILETMFGKSGILRLGPGTAPFVIAAWAVLATDELVKLARDLLSRQLRMREPSGSVVSSSQAGGSVPPAADTACDTEKAKLLINLMKADHVAEDRKTALIEPFLAGLALPAEEIHRLRRKTGETKPFKIEFQPFQEHPGRRFDLMMDLVGLACGETQMSRDRLQFVKETGVALGFPAEEMEWLMTEEARAKAFKSRPLLP